jgi:hypothetical protein
VHAEGIKKLLHAVFLCEGIAPNMLKGLSLSLRLFGQARLNREAVGVLLIFQKLYHFLIQIKVLLLFLINYNFFAYSCSVFFCLLLIIC